jgi:hypothetical protein
MLEYADILSKGILESIKGITENSVAFIGSKLKLDLHPEYGYMLSTKKIITCKDNRGNRYKITVEANPVDSLQEKLAQSNKKHSRNGDPLSHLVESLTFKLDAAAHDRSVLAEITPEEIEALQFEIQAAKSVKENTVGSF